MAKQNGSAGSTHGGARPGAGRKPKALIFGPSASAVEQTIVDVLPKIIDKMVLMALDGNLSAGRYLVDRILGRPCRLSAAPVEDRALPYAEDDYERELGLHDRKIAEYKRIQDLESQPREPFRLFGMTWEECKAKLEDRALTPTERLGKAIDAELARRKLAGET